VPRDRGWRDRKRHGSHIDTGAAGVFCRGDAKLDLAAEITQRKVELLAALTVVTLEVSHVLEAIKLHRLYRLSFWGALILHAAKTAGCGRLMTEDLQDGQIVEGMQIVNPFRLSP
jgi:predicted nucleic acid-binding protein